jgi:DeoR family fructose operon transcriptional repressor
MIEQTHGTVIVVADHTKIGTVADFVVAPLERVDTLVVDSGIGPELRDQLTEEGLQILIADDMVEAVAGG